MREQNNYIFGLFIILLVLISIFAYQNGISFDNIKQENKTINAKLDKIIESNAGQDSIITLQREQLRLLRIIMISEGMGKYLKGGAGKYIKPDSGGIK